MADRWQDDDDWSGTPPEGRHTRDQAKPEYWRNQRAPQLIVGAMGLMILVVVLLVVLLG